MSNRGAAQMRRCLFALASNARSFVVAAALAAAVPAHAQAPAPPPAGDNGSPPTPEGAAAPGAAGAAQQMERAVVTRDKDADVRRNSTAARIVIGREEIERFGDSSITETLRRLPGITSGGRPGRGGDPRMRGMGSGYTQILVNGERMPPGFSLDSLPPDQVERIEIMRAPTAEHGARAVAGTINIVLREPLEKRANDIRVGASTEQGLVSPGASWTRNDVLGAAPYTTTLSAQHGERRDDIDTRTFAEDLATGAPVLEQHETGTSLGERDGVHFNGRIQWRLRAASTLVLQPFAVLSQSNEQTTRDLVQTLGATPPAYAHAVSDSESQFRMLRINLTGNHRLDGGTRLELRGYVGASRGSSDLVRLESDDAGNLLRRFDHTGEDRDRSGSFNGKVSHGTSTEHALVGGWEAELLTREQARRTLENGAPLLTEFGEQLSARSQRAAAFLQDEWNPSKQWSAYAGVRWERIDTRSEDATQRVSNRSDVWTPLAHAVWRPEPDARDQVRMSLTRSYKSPTLSDLVGRPTINTRFPVPGGNIATSPDRAGNPGLKPELARGLDIAYEKYLAQGGVLSVNFFYRQITDLIRQITSLEDVSWATVPRWVSRPRNVGGATTRGVELEAKFRLDELFDGGPPLSVNSNLSVFDSSVDGVPGPNNFIDSQPRATANLGFEYRMRSAPLRLGANLNWTPGRTVRRSDIQEFTTDRKTVADAFVLWLIDTNTRLRVSASNFAPGDFVTSSTILADAQRQTSINGGETFTTLGVRLEMKL